MAKPTIQDSIFGGDGGNASTTYVQADSTCFKDLVQRLTGPDRVKPPAPKPNTKLHERRRHRMIKPKIEISKPFGFQLQPASQPSSGGGYGSIAVWAYPSSPSSVIMTSLSLSPSPISTPGMSSNKRSSASQTAAELNHGEEEERAIKEKRFYLHPSPRSKQRMTISDGPELLTLFPPPTDATKNVL